MAKGQRIGRLGEATAAGPRRQKAKVTVNDKVFEALAAAKAEDRRITIREIAEKIHVNTRAISLSISYLRRLGFRVNCKFKEYVDGAQDQMVYEYWFPDEDEPDQYRKNKGEDLSSEIEAKSHAIEVLTAEVDALSELLEESERCSSDRLAELSRLGEELGRLIHMKAQEVLGHYRVDVLTEIALVLAPAFGLTMEDEGTFRSRVRAILTQDRARREGKG